MSGVLCVIAASTPPRNNFTLTCGTVTLSGKGFSVVQNGFANTANSVTGSAFGSISPTTWHGFTITGLYSENTNGAGFASPTFAVSGDSTAFGAQVFVGGTDQMMSTGTFSGGQTKYVGTNPNINGTGTQAVIIFG